MVLQWLLSGLLALLSGFGLLRSAVSLESYVLLVIGVALAAGGTVLMARNTPGAAAA